MRISIRINTCDDSMGEFAVEDCGTRITFDYDRDDLAHELLNAYRDIFKEEDKWLDHLSNYLSDGDLVYLGGTL